jgi:hypothetical protein
MSSGMNTRQFRWFGGAALGALTLAAVSIPLSPARAFIGVDLAPVTIGVPGPVHYGPGPYYGPYHRHYYPGPAYPGPAYYDYGW